MCLVCCVCYAVRCGAVWRWGGNVAQCCRGKKLPAGFNRIQVCCAVGSARLLPVALTMMTTPRAIIKYLINVRDIRDRKWWDQKNHKSNKLTKALLIMVCSPSRRRYMRPKPLLSLAVRMVTAEEVLIVVHRRGCGIPYLQSLGKAPEQRSQRNIQLSIRKRHSHTLSRAATERYHVVVQFPERFGALQPTLRIEFHGIWKDV